MKRVDWFDPQTKEEKAKTKTPPKSKAKVKLPANRIIHNINLLDVSGSMLDKGKYTAAVAGLRGELLELNNSKEASMYRHTIMCFDAEGSSMRPDLAAGVSSNRFVWTLQDTVVVAPDQLTLPQPHGWTPLNDAIIAIIDYAFKVTGPDDTALIKIYTDGGENYSTTKDHWNVAKAKVKEARDKGYTVVFIGTDYDVKAAIRKYDVPVGSTMSHANDGATMTTAFFTTTSSTMRMAKKFAGGQHVNTSRFYEDDEEGKKED